MSIDSDSYNRASLGWCQVFAHWNTGLLLEEIEEQQPLTHSSAADDVTYRAAVFSPDRRHRYLLERRFGAGSKLVAFVGINPSTAGVQDDPTLRRMMGFARRADIDARELLVVNLCARVATDPRRVRLGPLWEDRVLNVSALERVGPADLVIAAWGAHAALVGAAVQELRTISRCAAELRCLGLTRDGSPRHPLYLRRDAPLQVFELPQHGKVEG